MDESFVIAHVTDLHIGAHSDPAWSALSNALSDLSPNLVVISGDITDANEMHDYRFFLDWLKDAISPNGSEPRGLVLHSIIAWQGLCSARSEWNPPLTCLLFEVQR